MKVLAQGEKALIPKDGFVVDCDLTECGVAQVYEQINRFIDLLIYGAILLGVVLMVYAGFVLIFKADSTSSRSLVKSMITGYLVGLFLLLGAYLLVTSVFDIFGYNLGDGNPFTFDI